MNDNMCEKCKYSFVRGTSQFDNSASFFEPANAEDAERGEIDHPAHYAGEIEFIDAMLETMGWADVRTFCLCSAFQYLWPCKKKHAIPTEDVEKALWYLEKYIKLGGNL